MQSPRFAERWGDRVCRIGLVRRPRASTCVDSLSCGCSTASKYFSNP